MNEHTVNDMNRDVRTLLLNDVNNSMKNSHHEYREKVRVIVSSAQLSQPLRTEE